MVEALDGQGNQGFPDIAKYSCMRECIAVPNSVCRGCRFAGQQVPALGLAA
jgi:hypothetical protein